MKLATQIPTWLALAISVSAPLSLRASDPRALPEGRLPDDSRLGALRTLNSYFPFTPVESPNEWKQRANQLRRQVLVATGLWPLPTRTPLNARIHGKVDREGYTVEKVILESFPGHYVTGSLYKPGDLTGKTAAILTPHGHWSRGRFYDHGDAKVRQEIASGAERFETGGRYHLQARCVQLARMGCVVFHYDMVGYADSVQITHRPGFREKMNTAENWGFFSPQAELRLQNMMGLQTWNSIRALDFLSSLPEVDASRIGVTGASGGGTQTFILGAVDDRPAVLLPAVMVSTAMQGGCTCENACYLRVGAGNIDLAALAAPRPLALTGADDWTVEIMTKGLPDLEKLYAMLGQKDRVSAKAFLHFGHNYNSVSRTVMYNWMNRHLKLGFKEPVLEDDFLPLSVEEMSVWNDEFPRPTGDAAGDVHERKLLQWVTRDSESQLVRSIPKDPSSLKDYRRLIGGALEVMVGRDLNSLGTLDYELSEKVDRGDYLEMTALVTNPAVSEQLPTLYLYPKKEWNGDVVLWVGNSGKRAILTNQGDPTPAVSKLLAAGFAVASADLFLQGEFLKAGESATNRQVDQRYAGYTFGYNHPLFSQRVHDVLTMIKFIQTDKHGAKRIHLVGIGKVAAPIAMAARALAGDAVRRAAFDADGFRFANVSSFADPMFLPGAVKYLGVAGLLSLNAPQQTWVRSGVPHALVEACFEAAAQPRALTTYDGGDPAQAAVEWLKR